MARIPKFPVKLPIPNKFIVQTSPQGVPKVYKLGPKKKK